MQAVDLRQIVFLLIAVYFVYKFIGKPIIGLVLSLTNVLSILRISKNKPAIIIKFPNQEKVKRNVAEILSMVLLFFLILLMFKSYYAIVILAGLLTTFTEIVTPIIYNKYNGIYPDYIVINKKYMLTSIHSWKKIESNKSLSFLGKNGLRFDVYVGHEYDKSIDYLNSNNIPEEI